MLYSDLSFPRLGQMIVDYEQPVRRLADEFVPHTKLLSGALRSLWPVYVQRNLTADKWRLKLFVKTNFLLCCLLHYCINFQLLL